MTMGGSFLETLLIQLQGASGEDALVQRQRVMGYINHADENTILASIREISDRRLLRQLMGVGVRGRANRALNAQLDKLGG